MLKRMIRSILITFILLLGLTIQGSAAVIKKTDVTKASSGCVLAGIRGQYIAGSQQALDRMNAIRLEACREHVKNPATGRALTLADYVPLKWSADMEYIARIRAAESSITLGHIRTNGRPWYDIYSSGRYADGELIAWNYTTSMVSGVEQWYEEKNDWVTNTGAVTGHYEAIINPKYRYVGIGSFYCKNVEYYNTTVGEFSSSKAAWSTVQGTGISDVIQILNVKNFYYNKYRSAFVMKVASTVQTPQKSVKAAASTTKTNSVKAVNPKKTSSISVNIKSVTLRKGKKLTLKVKVNPSTSKEKVKFKSSKKAVASVSAKGVIKAKKKGKVNITITSGKAKAIVKVVVK